MKNWILTALCAVGGVISTLFGGWTGAMTTLLICNIADYTTGLIVGGLFHKSPKTATGGLESRAGWKGLVRKLSTWVFVLIGYRLEMMTGQPIIKDAVCIFFVCNEAISIVENIGLMGVPIPPVIKKMIDTLQDKDGGNDG